MTEHDLVIKNGNVITFDPDIILHGYNIAVANGKIKEITEEEIKGKTEIDAKGKYVSPGFIDFHSHVNGRMFSAECLLRQGATTTIGGERNFDTSIIREIEENGFLINHGFYISYSFTLRKAVGLQEPSQKASKTEIANMIKLAERFYQFGVLGIHIGLEYIPGTSEEELECLFEQAKKYRKIVMVHLRKDGYDSLESLKEIISIAERTGASVNVLHIMYTAGLPELIDEFLKLIEKARNRGCDITGDTGVFSAYPTFSGSQNLDEDFIHRHKIQSIDNRLMISSGVHAGEFCDSDMFKYIRSEHPATLMTVFLYDEAQIEKVILPEYIMISTNAAYGPHHNSIGHPETTGTYPKLLASYVRDKCTLPLSDAIKKITFLPACRLSLENKGNIKKGMDADITIFDLDKIKCNSDYVGYGNPNEFPEGITDVIVNGQVVLSDGKLTGIMNAGQIIKQSSAINQY